MDIAVRSGQTAAQRHVPAADRCPTVPAQADVPMSDTVTRAVPAAPGFYRTYLAPARAAIGQARGVMKEAFLWSLLFGAVTRGGDPLVSCAIQSGLTPRMARTPLQRWNTTLLLDEHWSRAFPHVIAHLQQSNDFQQLLSRLAASPSEIVIQHAPEQASVIRFGTKAVVRLDVYSGTEYFDIYGRNCRQGSVAQGLAHELSHADMHLHNRLGTGFLSSLHDPEFDSFEEFRATHFENRVAEAFGLTPRTSHLGLPIPVKSVTEGGRHCADAAPFRMHGRRTRIPEEALRMKALRRLWFYTEVVQRLPRIDIDLLLKVRTIYIKHAPLFNDYRSFLNGEHTDVGSVTRWKRHRDAALELAERFADRKIWNGDCPLPLMKSLIRN